MRDDFCAFILTHGRPDKVYTYRRLRGVGYTGQIYLVIDDEDKMGAAYRERYGDEVVTFSKRAIAETFDEADNTGDRRSVVYARNACFPLARELGYRYFIQLDDDYTSFFYRFDQNLDYRSLRMRSIDDVLEALVDFLIAVPRCDSIAMSQGGDHIGGGIKIQLKKIQLKRKAMNTFVCDVDRPFSFVGRINEDVNTYTWGSRLGMLFFTFMGYQVNQVQTQASTGGMTELYLDSGTYIKSFYSVMFAPSCVRIGELADGRTFKEGREHRRIHHSINWRYAAPKILRETHRKVSQCDWE